ncbi:MAG TPA: AEC family transporter, partial [Rhodospirillales bacterium]|nr:AEC family transporter [Rhodospirillales bacterium]
YGGGQIITFAMAFAIARLVFKQNLTDGTLRALASAYCNIGYMGLPLVIIAFGPDWTAAAVVATVINISMLLVGTITILEISQSEGGSRLRIIRDVARGVFKNPQFLAPAAGIAWSFTGQDLAAPIATFTSILGAAAGPCALFALGLFLVGKPLNQDMKEISWIIVAKLWVQPLITWGLALWLLADEPMWLTLAVLLAAMPTGTTVFVFASKYGVYVRQASAAVMITTALSVATLSVLFVIWSDRIL